MMEGALWVALSALLIIGVCVQLAVALRNWYVKTAAEGGRDAEKDVEGFDAELELQLQGELDEAIEASTPLLASGKTDLVDTSLPLQVRFAENGQSSWTTFKRESRAKLQQLATSLNILAKDEGSVDQKFMGEEFATPNRHMEPSMTEVQHQAYVRRQLPLLDAEGGLAERNVMVNAKQYSRILKRRYARQLMEGYFRSQPEPEVPTFRGTGCMRRPRGPGGRFLTAEELPLLEAEPLVHGMVAAR